MKNSDQFSSQVKLELQDERSEPLPDAFDLKFFFSDKKHISTLPSHSAEPAPRPVVDEFELDDLYWDAVALHLVRKHRLVRVRLKVTNRSEVPLTDVEVEINALGPSGRKVLLQLVKDLPMMPVHPMHRYQPPNNATTLLPNPQMKIVNFDERSVCRIIMGVVRPGESATAPEDLAVLPNAPGNYVLETRLLAKEINPFLTYKHRIKVTGEMTELNFDRLRKLS